MTTYADTGEGARVYHNIVLIRLDDEGRCFDFVEYFMRVPEPNRMRFADVNSV